MSGRSWHGATRWNRGEFVCVADANRMLWVERVINYSQNKLLFAQMYRCVWIFCVFVAVATTSNKNIKHQDIDLLHLRTVKARQYIFMALFRNSLLHLMAILLSFFFFCCCQSQMYELHFKLCTSRAESVWNYESLVNSDGNRIRLFSFIFGSFADCGERNLRRNKLIIHLFAKLVRLTRARREEAGCWIRHVMRTCSWISPACLPFFWHKSW